MKSPLRERAHEVLRAELAERAFDLIVEHGFEEQSSEELARRLDISRASFFRYLGSKEEVVVTVMLGDIDQFAAALPPRAAAGEEPISDWRRIQRACEIVIRDSAISAERQRAGLMLLRAVPALGARLRRARFPQIEALASALRGSEGERFASVVLAGVGIAALDQCWAEWARTEGTSMQDTVAAAFAEIERATAAR